MNFAVLSIPDFPLHALRYAEPALRGKAVAIITGEGRKAALAFVAHEANASPRTLPYPSLWRGVPAQFLEPG